MKTFPHQIVTLALTLSTATAADPPVGIIAVNPLANCVDANTLGQFAYHALPLDVCVPFEGFYSFQGGYDDEDPCPEKTMASVTAYDGKDCSGIEVSAGVLPTNGSLGVCTNILEDGKSARFTCAYQ